MRYAAAVGFALLALALIGLWVRSYWWYDEIAGEIGQSLAGVGSNRGVIVFGLSDFLMPFDPQGWKLKNYQLHDNAAVSSWTDRTALGFGILERDMFGPSGLYLPHWFLLTCSISLSGVLAFRPMRFSLRGLLIATTLLAGLLGLAVYAV